jgi:predicted PurR-regulated permease PerM
MFGIDPRAAKYTFTAALVLSLLFGVFQIRGTLFVVTVSLLLAYLLYPLVDRVNRYLPSRSRTPALAIVYLLLIGVVVALGVTIGTQAAEEAASLSERAPALIERMKQGPAATAPAGIQSVKETVLGAVQSYIYKHYNEMVSVLPTLTLKVLKASTNALYLVIVPVISFFILKDGRQLRDEFLDLVQPGHSREFAEVILQDIHSLLLQYMRALFTLCSVTLVVFSIVLSVMGVPYAILLASVAFPLEFIPLIGPLVAAVAIISVTILSGYPHIVLVVAFLGAYRLVQDYFISPRLMSAGVELHPLLVIVGVLAGGEIGGVEGTFLSVPVLALLRVVYRRIRLARVSARGTVVSRP